MLENGFGYFMSHNSSQRDYIHHCFCFLVVVLLSSDAEAISCECLRQPNLILAKTGISAAVESRIHRVKEVHAQIETSSYERSASKKGN